MLPKDQHWERMIGRNNSNHTIINPSGPVPAARNRMQHKPVRIPSAGSGSSGSLSTAESRHNLRKSSSEGSSSPPVSVLIQQFNRREKDHSPSPPSLRRNSSTSSQKEQKQPIGGGSSSPVPNVSRQSSGSSSSSVRSLPIVEKVTSIVSTEENSNIQASHGSHTYPKKKIRWRNLPERIWETIFTYVDLKDLKSVSLTCRKFNRVLLNESSIIWKHHCHKQISKSILKSDILINVPTYKSRLRAFFYSWDPNDCSRNIYIKSNGFTLHRNPVAQSTDAAKGKIGFKSGRHSWEIWWEGPLGTVAVIGVATHEAAVQSPGYVPLLGSNSESWGWNLVDNHLLHNGDCHGSFPLQNNPPKYQTGERLRVILDSDDQTLSFERNYEFLGVAFRGLPKNRPLYPCVSAVYGNTEVTMVYLGPPLDG